MCLTAACWSRWLVWVEVADTIFDCTRSLAAITGDECPYGPWHCAEALGVGMGVHKGTPFLGSSDLRSFVLSWHNMHLHLTYLCIKLPFFWIQSSFAICLLWRSPVWSWLSLSIVRLTTSRKTDGYRMMTRHWFGHRVLAAEFVDETCKLLLLPSCKLLFAYESLSLKWWDDVESVETVQWATLLPADLSAEDWSQDGTLWDGKKSECPQLDEVLWLRIPTKKNQNGPHWVVGSNSRLPAQPGALYHPFREGSTAWVTQKWATCHLSPL